MSGALSSLPVLRLCTRDLIAASEYHALCMNALSKGVPYIEGEKVAYDELELSVHLWRQRDVSGVFLCYKFRGLVPVGLHSGGSRLFNADVAIDEALIDAHISPSIIGEDEKAAAVFGLT